MQRYSVLRLAVLAALGLGQIAQAQTANQQSVEELRNTLVSVMEALVQKGLLSREQAAQIVGNAQTKAAADARQKAEQELAEKDAVVVTRIPETIKQDIVKQVSTELRPLVKQDVVDEAKAKQWGVPGAMPDWLSRIKLSGDVRFRAQSDNFADANASVPNDYQNILAINKAGTLAKAGTDAYFNITEDRLRERLRLRVGLDARIGNGLSASARLATGSLTDPVSPNQTLGQSGNRYQIAVDQAFIKYEAKGSAQLPWSSISMGRFASPWLSTDLVWDPDLQFEGLAGTWRYVAEKDSTLPRNVFMTLAAVPLQEVELSSKDKWLYGAQLGVDFPWDGGARLQLAGAYYYYDNITGVKNASQSNLMDFTAPQFMQKGNSVFDISNDVGTDADQTHLYALAAEYHLLDVTAVLDIPVARHQVTVTADYVRNLGYQQQDVLNRSGYATLADVPEVTRADFIKQTTGWQVELAAGTRTTGKKGNWRTALSYKRLERDAVLDAFTDSDFHLGGTGAKGYAFKTDWWFRNRNFVTLRYVSSDEISNSVLKSDGTLAIDLNPFGVDTVMLDFTAQF